MTKVFLFLNCIILVFACKTSSDSEKSRDEQKYTNPYRKVAEDLKEASHTYIGKCEEDNDLRKLADAIYNEDEKGLADKMSHPDFEKILEESKKEEVKLDFKEKSHAITYVGIGVASFGVVILASGCMHYRKGDEVAYRNTDMTDPHNTGKKKAIGKMAIAMGGAAIAAGTVAVILNETLQLAETCSQARGEYIAALNRIGKELLLLRANEPKLNLANPCKFRE